MEKNLSLEDLFTSEPKNPFHYDVNLSNNNNLVGPEAIFENLKNIFIQGLVIISNGEVLNNGDEKSIDIDKMTEKDFKKIKDRMLSIGVEAKYKTYNMEDKDYYLRGLMYKLEKIDGIKMSVTMDWHSQLINKVDFHLRSKEILPTLISTLEQCPEANYFLNMSKPKDLKDYCIKYIKKNEPEKLHVINFDAAKVSDYQYQHHFCDQFTRHIK
tara:strand:- start:1387 stop:2025 length:639 start_codon:yes stop_codon:yes gene_type:complete